MQKFKNYLIDYYRDNHPDLFYCNPSIQTVIENKISSAFLYYTAQIEHRKPEDIEYEIYAQLTEDLNIEICSLLENAILNINPSFDPNILTSQSFYLYAYEVRKEYDSLFSWQDREDVEVCYTIDLFIENKSKEAIQHFEFEPIF